MSSPTTVNKATVFIEGVISALMSGGELAAEAYITALEPEIFGIPFFHWLMTEAVSYMGQFLQVAGEKFADNVAVDIQTKGEESDVITAATALAIAEASNDPVAIAGAVKAAGAAYKAAFNLDGWGNPH